ncbi:flagellar basal-body rod protein FlgF [Siccirubricoccus sp. KC 17139]|uniref:Flagellar basal-body rod protein FlgF n=1 Tax=Siccirubricoccus soli TaxID=2899147 RepID=A0ABT1D980_9PROT|nr:flagellar basal-body rod protein FlgF [Siccirubricoccus soli]MCO6418414.1 flagellar basal-body rod protein FlgF [Siccirubricoccus soli]MCP2684549.1 flagellar basal-body rod protein FlgF [Siccirubricoccus soli]
MDTPGYVILSRLGAQMRAMSVVANNLANADTAGFHSEREIFSRYLQRDPLAERPRSGRDVAYTIDRATWRNTGQGPLTATGNPLDVAIHGEGYFAVETPRGERYTRAGRFTLDQDGKLVDAEGNDVLGEQGGPIVFARGDSRIEIMGDGTVRTENGVVGRLRVVRFADPQRLRAEGNRLFAADDAPEPVPRPSLLQGSYEGSNVSAVLEMVRLTEESREFQMVTQFAEREGERLQTAVERILRRRS